MLSLRKINWLVLQHGKFGAFCCCGGIQYRYQQINSFYVSSLNYVFNNSAFTPLKIFSYFYLSIRPLPKCNKKISYIIHAFTEWISAPFQVEIWSIKILLQIENKPTRPPPISPSISNLVHFTYIPSCKQHHVIFNAMFTEWQKVNNPTHFHNSAISLIILIWNTDRKNR